MTPSRILVATSLGSASAEAQRHAARLVRQAGASVALCHAVPHSDRHHHPPAWLDELRQVITRQFLQNTDGTQPGAVFVDEGPVDQALMNRAAAWMADLVVVGGHRHHPSPSLLAGVAERIVRRTDCPVLVTRPETGSGVILAGVDFEDTSPFVVRAADAEAQRRAWSLTLVHCQELHPIYAEYGMSGMNTMYLPTLEVRHVNDRRVQERMDEALLCCHARAAGLVREGEPASVLTQEAGDRQADLLVVGCGGRTGFTRFLLGSTAETIIRSATCSVLVVRQRRA